MAIAATNDTDVNIAVFDDAERRAMLVNVVDVPPLCNFILPAIVRTGPLAIAISTAGASPALAKRMKREIEGQFGEPYARLAVLLNEVRGWAKGTLPTYQDRKEFFEGIVNGEPDPVALLRDGDEQAVRELIARAQSAHALQVSRAPSVAALEVEGLARHYGEREALSGVSLSLAGGPDARRVRPQRRRQDDAAARARDAAAPARGHRARARREPAGRGVGGARARRACSDTSRCSTAS